VYVVVVVVVVVAAMAIGRYEKERNLSIVRKNNPRLAMTYSEH
jgi:uncharacterized protein YneF (UPF0154 family)